MSEENYVAEEGDYVSDVDSDEPLHEPMGSEPVLNQAEKADRIREARVAQIKEEEERRKAEFAQLGANTQSAAEIADRRREERLAAMQEEERRRQEEFAALGAHTGSAAEVADRLREERLAAMKEEEQRRQEAFAQLADGQASAASIADQRRLEREAERKEEDRLRQQKTLEETKRRMARKARQRESLSVQAGESFQQHLDEKEKQARQVNKDKEAMLRIAARSQMSQNLYKKKDDGESSLKLREKEAALEKTSADRAAKMAALEAERVAERQRRRAEADAKLAQIREKKQKARLAKIAADEDRRRRARLSPEERKAEDEERARLQAEKEAEDKRLAEEAEAERLRQEEEQRRRDEEERKRREEEERKQREEEEEEAERARIAALVYWEDDSKAVSCPFCAKAFHHFRRRHHCRACGRIACWECSTHKGTGNDNLQNAPKGVNKQIKANPNDQRVCDACFKKQGGSLD